MRENSNESEPDEWNLGKVCAIQRIHGYVAFFKHVRQFAIPCEGGDLSFESTRFVGPLGGGSDLCVLEGPWGSVRLECHGIWMFDEACYTVTESSGKSTATVRVPLFWGTWIGRPVLTLETDSGDLRFSYEIAQPTPEGMSKSIGRLREKGSATWHRFVPCDGSHGVNESHRVPMFPDRVLYEGLPPAASKILLAACVFACTYNVCLPLSWQPSAS
jgi:hypothetical protein